MATRKISLPVDEDLIRRAAIMFRPKSRSEHLGTRCFRQPRTATTALPAARA
jgi:hypothetical protein